MRFRLWQTALVTGTIIVLSGLAEAAEWTPDKWVNENTIKLCTKSVAAESYCFPVWLVVLDGEVYVRLGTKAAERINKVGRQGGGGGLARTGDTLAVEVAGQRFDNVGAVASQGAAKRVAEAMAAKYWMDVVVRYLPHPITVMLAPDVEVR